ncbi:MAG: hypothetical protein CSA07_04305 [Bacteroidia bacterium]|nr:MAG: hypothetical protein CSA07_04305 [Bacteroidia bacterium]
MLSARDVKLKVRLDAQVPSPMMLLRQVDTPQSLLDTAYMDDDGCYHFSIPDFQPGLYGLQPEGGAAIPLLLLEPKRQVWVGIDGRMPLDAIVVKGADEAMTFLAGHTAYTRYRAFEQALGNLQRHCEGGAEASCRAMEAIVRGQERTLDSTLRALERASRNERIHPFLWLMRPVAGQRLTDWFPQALLNEPLMASSQLLRRRATEYLLAYRDTLMTHEEQQAAFLEAIRNLGEHQMHPDVAVSIRGQLSYLFSGSSFPRVAEAVDSMHFGPLAGLPDSVRRPGPVEHSEALALRMQDLRGASVPVINPKSRYTLVILWSVWCPHCQTMLPRLYELWRGMDKRFMRVSCIGIDHGEQGADAAYMRSRDWGWDNGFQPQESSQPLEEALAFRGTPELYVYDVQGKLISRPATEYELRATIERLEELESQRTDKRW